MKASEFTNDLIGKEISFFEDGIADFMTMKPKKFQTKGKIIRIERTDSFLVVTIHRVGDVYSIIGENFEYGYNTIHDAKLID